MSASIHRLLARVVGWPRRIAALVCLLLAAGSAMLPTSPASPSPQAVHGISARLHSGEVAVSVPITSTAGVRGVVAGDLVGVLAQPADNGASPAVLVADRLRAISVDADNSGLADGRVVIVVATDHTRALRLARYLAVPLLLIIDGLT